MPPADKTAATAAPAADAPRPTTKSQRSAIDTQTPMGIGTTRAQERVAASLGKLPEPAAPRFEASDDVSGGGVLMALPALLSIGLLRHTRKFFVLPAGYYGIESIFLTLAFMALARIRSLEALRYEAPGEWGRIFGIDRIPEVRTLRAKLGLLCENPASAAGWSSTLGLEWMQADPEAAGTLLIDGHIRVYHGSLTKLPRHYVSRERLCLRATADYWVNALDGAPFFVITKAVDPGLIKTMREDIVPRLEKDIPGQPSIAALLADLLLQRFTLIFDREGYSPDFFREMNDQRIAIITYHKHPGDPWPADEFHPVMVRLQNGEEIEHLLAERGTCLSNGLWVREVRHLDGKGHQTAILSTAWRLSLHRIAAAMFARWSQENFFKYMRQHYGLDALVEYGTTPLPDATPVVNPARRALESTIRSERSKLTREQAEFGAHTLPHAVSAAEATAFEEKKGRLLATIEARENEIAALIAKRKETPRKMALKDLPPEHRFEALSGVRKHFVDTIKLIAYRAETALVHAAREHLAREDDARSLVRCVLDSAVDLRPNPAAKELEVRFHTLTSPAHNAVLAHLCTELTETLTIYPGTEMRLIFVPPGPS